LNLYVESSALAAWLLNEKTASRVVAAMGAAISVAASELTFAECHRALRRAEALGGLAPADAKRLRRRLAMFEDDWVVLPLSPEILVRAGQPFPAEPIRTLDAVHLAVALRARASVPDLIVLSLDNRVRAAASALGFPLAP
jgi:predicted nucleic acid-binding protein